MPIGRPDVNEYPEYGKKYVDLVPGDDVVSALHDCCGLRAFEGIPDAAAEQPYAPGKWTIKESLLHVIDTERIFAGRLLRIARGDKTVLPGFEQDEYVPYSGANARTITSLIAEFRAVRHATLALVEGLPEAAWTYQGTVNTFSCTPRGLAYMIAGHELHHVKLLQERYLSAAS